MFLRDIKMKHSLREGCSFLEFFWFVFSLIRTEYGKVLLISPDLVRMRENVDKKNSLNTDSFYAVKRDLEDLCQY